MSSHEEIAPARGELREHRESMGLGGHHVRDHSHTYPDMSDTTEITSLAATLTDPR